MRTALVAMVIGGAAWAAGAWAQANLPFSGFSHDASLPVQISADALDVSQADARATFTGGVVVGQGELRLAADEITVFYSGETATGRVTRMEAAGNVTLTNGAESAEAQAASYDVASGIVDMSGDVLLTQGENALSGQALSIDLNAGTAQMQGRVQTILQPQADQ
ncbi:MAG: lipopolysaccharide transport periplasmic protein LptA [Pseudomonadota bacterium]